jgi:hypothetical protein
VHQMGKRQNVQNSPVSGRLAPALELRQPAGRASVGETANSQQPTVHLKCSALESGASGTDLQGHTRGPRMTRRHLSCLLYQLPDPRGRHGSVMIAPIVHG